MTRDAYTKLTPEALVEAYIAVGVQQDRAIESFDTKTFNRLYPRKRAIAEELKSRPGDQQTYLVPPLQHPNWQVRLNAAKELLVVAPAEARETLVAIAESRHFPHAGDAGMCLWTLDQGIFEPQ
jgi:hypothetical protein